MIYPAALGEQIIKIQDCVQICPARAGQIGVTWALDHLQDWRDDRTREMAEKADAFATVLRDTSDWHIASIGAYFAYLRHPFNSLSAEPVARRLATENGLLVIPGSLFGPGQDEYVRLSFGNLQPHALRELPVRLRLSDP